MELYQEFEYRMFAMLKKLGKDTVTWDSTFNTGNGPKLATRVSADQKKKAQTSPAVGGAGMKLPPNAVVQLVHSMQSDLGTAASVDGP
mgnify:CR=1 FL=1